jgi:predicted P-loop ATPase
MMADNNVDPYELSRDLTEQHKRAKRRREQRKQQENGEQVAPKQPGPRFVNMADVVGWIDDQPHWIDTLRMNLLTEAIEVSATFPPTVAPNGRMRPLREPDDLLNTILYLQVNGFRRGAKSTILDALTLIACRNAFHPVRDYLISLQWDGTERVGSLFREYFNADVAADDQDRSVAYLEHVSTCFMVAAVARVMDPGCKVDHLPVLIGLQGFGKSEGVRALCPDDAWFSDDLSPDLMQRDTKESLVGKWLIELAEVPHVRREVERVKAFFSRRTDRYRRAYDRTTQDHPRQCVFLGTSNDLELIDASGNRRFWPIEVAGDIDVARIIADRDQLWAEAVALYRQGVRWWLAPTIEAIAAERQQAFREHDTWEPILEGWLDQRDAKPCTLLQAMRAIQQIDENLILHGKADQGRVAACLKRLGYQRRQRRIEGVRDYWWMKCTKVWNSENAGDGGDTGDT